MNKSRTVLESDARPRKSDPAFAEVGDARLAAPRKCVITAQRLQEKDVSELTGLEGRLYHIAKFTNKYGFFMVSN